MAARSASTGSTSATPPRSTLWSPTSSPSGPLTDLINNAAGNFISRTEDLSPRGFDAVANIVMHGTFYVTHAVGRRWIAGGHRGNVVSIVVTWVYNGSPYVVPSAMSKSAINTMTMSLATEWAKYGIRLNAIAPGVIPTEGASKRLSPGEGPTDRTQRANPMGRVGTMAELQNLATFLIADGCEWLTGETITLDGGQSHATGSNFYELRNWSDAQWQAAREAIKAQNEKDRGAALGVVVLSRASVPEPELKRAADCRCLRGFSGAPRQPARRSAATDRGCIGTAARICRRHAYSSDTGRAA